MLILYTRVERHNCDDHPSVPTIDVATSDGFVGRSLHVCLNVWRRFCVLQTPPLYVQYPCTWWHNVCLTQYLVLSNLFCILVKFSFFVTIVLDCRQPRITEPDIFSIHHAVSWLSLVDVIVDTHAVLFESIYSGHLHMPVLKIVNWTVFYAHIFTNLVDDKSSSNDSTVCHTQPLTQVYDFEVPSVYQRHMIY